MRNLEYIRRMKRLSKSDMAKLLGISKSHYGRLSNPNSTEKPSMDLFIRICSILNITPCVLLCDDNTNTKSLRGRLLACKHCLLNTRSTIFLEMYISGYEWDKTREVLFNSYAKNLCKSINENTEK